MPNRLIKESIRTSERLNTLTDFQFRLWVALITYVDDFGRGDARPAVIRGTCFPLRERLTNKDISAALQALAGAGCVGLYEVDGKPYLYFPRWESHQTIRNKKSKFPAPAETCKRLNAIENNCEQLNANVPLIQSNPNPNPNPSESAPARHAHGKYGWVKLTDDEYARLLAGLGETEAERCISYIDESAQSTGNKNKWKDWNLIVRKCYRDGWGLNLNKPSRITTAAEYKRTGGSKPKDFEGLDELLRNGV